MIGARLGATPTIDWVHISWRSMVSTISGPSMWRMNCGRATREHRAQQRPGHMRQKREQYIADLPLNDGRIVIAQKSSRSSGSLCGGWNK